MNCLLIKEYGNIGDWQTTVTNTREKEMKQRKQEMNNNPLYKFRKGWNFSPTSR